MSASWANGDFWDRSGVFVSEEAGAERPDGEGQFNSERPAGRMFVSFSRGGGRLHPAAAGYRAKLVIRRRYSSSPSAAAFHRFHWAQRFIVRRKPGSPFEARHGIWF